MFRRASAVFLPDARTTAIANKESRGVPSIGEVAGDDLKAQLNEYHLLVAEVLGGMTAQMEELAKRLDAAEAELVSVKHELLTFKARDTSSSADSSRR